MGAVATEGMFVTEDIEKVCRDIAKEYEAPYRVYGRVYTYCEVNLGYNRVLRITDTGTKYTVELDKAAKRILGAEFLRIAELKYSCGTSRYYYPDRVVKSTTCSIFDSKNAVIITKEDSRVKASVRSAERKFRLNARIEL